MSLFAPNWLGRASSSVLMISLKLLSRDPHPVGLRDALSIGRTVLDSHLPIQSQWGRRLPSDSKMRSVPGERAGCVQVLPCPWGSRTLPGPAAVRAWGHIPHTQPGRHCLAPTFGASVPLLHHLTQRFLRVFRWMAPPSLIAPHPDRPGRGTSPRTVLEGRQPPFA